MRITSPARYHPMVAASVYLSAFLIGCAHANQRGSTGTVARNSYPRISTNHDTTEVLYEIVSPGSGKFRMLMGKDKEKKSKEDMGKGKGKGKGGSKGKGKGKGKGAFETSGSIDEERIYFPLPAIPDVQFSPFTPPETIPAVSPVVVFVDSPPLDSDVSSSKKSDKKKKGKKSGKCK
jgi:hypothetical protein